MNETLKVRNLNKSFATGFMGRKPVLKDVSFSVVENTVTGFVGVNGSGKTTTIKCLLGFIFPDKNTQTLISFFGDDRLTNKTKSRIAYLPERPYLPEQLTATEFLHFHWKLAGSPGNFKQRCEEVLSRVKLHSVEQTYLRHFSKGMLQRMGLAQALLHRPEFLILDEPMSGLDPDGRWIVKDIIREEQQRGATIFFSSHLLGDMDELCSHLVVIDQGHVHFHGLVSNFIQSENKMVSITYFDQSKKIIQLRTSQSDLQNKIHQIIAQNGEIIRVSPAESSIEAVFTQRKWLESKQT